MSAAVLALTLLAVARVTRLITSDRITERPRNFLLRKFLARNQESLTAYLMVCSWCSSVYVGAAAAGAWYVWGDTMCYQAVALALAASHVTGVLASRETGD